MIEGEGTLVRENFDQFGVRNFQIASAIEAEFIQSNKEGIIVEAHENILPYVQMERKGDRLFIHLSPKYKYMNAPVRVIISTRAIHGLFMSGASSAFFRGNFEAPSFELTLSGASAVQNLVLESRTCALNLSGASSIGARLIARSLDGSFTGASSAELKLQELGIVDLDFSGTSSAVLRGKAEQLDVEVSGAGDIEASRLEVLDAEVDLSGGSRAALWVRKTISYDLSGASKLHVTGYPKVISSNISGNSRYVKAN